MTDRATDRMHSVVLLLFLMHGYFSELNVLVHPHKRNHQITSVFCAADAHCGYYIYRLVIRIIYDSGAP